MQPLAAPPPPAQPATGAGQKQGKFLILLLLLGGLFIVAVALIVFFAASFRLRQQNYQFHLGIGNISGHEGRNVACPLHSFPRGSRLVQAKILIVQFYRNRTRR
jgi:hypothetical protein